MKRGIWRGQIASHSEVSDTARLLRCRSHASGPMRIRLIAVTWPHDMIRREHSSNHACHMQGRPTGYFLSEHVHVCEIFQKCRAAQQAISFPSSFTCARFLRNLFEKSRTRDRARKGNTVNIRLYALQLYRLDYVPHYWGAQRVYSRYPLMYHPHARTAMQEKVGYKRPRRDQK